MHAGNFGLVDVLQKILCSAAVAGVLKIDSIAVPAREVPRERLGRGARLVPTSQPERLVDAFELVDGATEDAMQMKLLAALGLDASSPKSSRDGAEDLLEATIDAATEPIDGLGLAHGVGADLGRETKGDRMRRLVLGKSVEQPCGDLVVEPLALDRLLDFGRPDFLTAPNVSGLDSALADGEVGRCG